MNDLESKIEWMLTELAYDGLAISQDELVRVLNGDEAGIDTATLDYIDELNHEWNTYGS